MEILNKFFSSDLLNSYTKKTLTPVIFERKFGLRNRPTDKCHSKLTLGNKGAFFSKIRQKI